jgi:GT2 family glycosyltransferase
MQKETIKPDLLKNEFCNSCNIEEIETKISKPLISVVVATKGYERELLLETCLRSLQKQTFQNFEIVLVFSIFPNKLTNLIEDCNILALKETSSTLGAARNLGVKNAKGEIVVFIDDDAEAPENWLAKIYSAFNKYPSVICLGGGYLAPLEEDKTSPLKFVAGSFMDSIIRQNVSIDRSAVGKIAGCNVAYRKEVFEKVGYINEKYRSGEDWDFHIRLIENGYNLRFDPDIYVWHHRGSLKHSFWNSTRMVPFFLSWKTLKYARYEPYFAAFYLTNIAFLVLLVILLISPFVFVFSLFSFLLAYFTFTAIRTKTKTWKIIYYPLMILYTLARITGFYYGMIKGLKKLILSLKFKVPGSSS